MIRNLGRLILAIVLLALLILVGYVVYKYVLPKWVAILFYSYTIVSVVVVIFSLLATRAKLKESKTLSDDIAAAFAKAQSNSDFKVRFNRIRDTLSTVVGTIALAPAWPAGYMTNARVIWKSPGKQLTARELVLMANLRPMPLYFSLFAFVVVALFVGLESRNLDLGVYGTLVLWFMVAGVSARHLQYLIQTASLPTLLRRSTANPYLAFLVIAAADLSTLVLALAAIATSSHVSTLGLLDLRDMAAQILKAGDFWTNVWHGILPTGQHLVIAIVGLLFSAAVLKVILEFRQFRRTDEDWVFLATVHVMLGKFAHALRDLENVEAWNNGGLFIQSVGYLGVGELAKAEEKVRAALARRGKYREEMVITSLTQGGLLGPVPVDSLVGIVRRAVELGVRDAALQDDVLNVAKSNARVQPILVELISAVKEKYRLTMAVLLTITNQFDDAIDLLKVECPDGLDELIRHFWVLTASCSRQGISQAEMADAVRSTLTEVLPEIRELIDAPATLLWERMILFSLVTTLLEIARLATPEKVEELTFLSDQLKARTEGKDVLTAMNALEVLAASA